MDSGSRSAAFAQLAMFVVSVHAVEHDEFYDIRVNFLPFKQIADPV